MKTFLSCCKTSTKRASLIVIICLAANFTYAQFPNQHLDNFWEICSKNEPYFDSVIAARGYGNMAGTGFTQYQRFKQKWQYLVPPSGNINEVYLRMSNSKNQLNSMKSDINSTEYASAWYEMGPKFITPGPENGRLSTLAIDPENENIILAASGAGGLFYSTDGGTLFQNAGTDNLTSPMANIWLTNGVSSIVISKYNGIKYWFIATGDRDNSDSPTAGIYRSNDMGGTWIHIGDLNSHLPIDRVSKINKIIALPGNPQIMLAATQKGIYRIDNAFSDSPTWQLVTTETSKYFDIAIKPEPSGQTTNLSIYASAEYYNYPGSAALPYGALIKSVDNGLSWQEITQFNNFLPALPFVALRIVLETTIADPDNLFIYQAHGGVTAEGSIEKLRFNDNQITHYLETPNDSNSPDTTSNAFNDARLAFAISPINKEEIYIGCIDLFKLHIRPIAPPEWLECEESGMHLDIHEIVYNNSGSEVWVASDGGLSKKTGYISCEWENKSNGIAVSTCTIMDHSKAFPDDYLIGCWDTGADIFRKDLNSWTQTSGNDIWQGTFDLTLKGTYYISGNVGGAKRYENYYSSQDISAPDNSNNSGIHIIPNSQFGNKIYQTSFDYLYRSDNRGDSWEVCTPANLYQPTDYVVWDAFTAPSVGSVLYLSMIHPYVENALYDDLLFKTSNITATYGSSVIWNQIELPSEWSTNNDFGSKNFSSIAVDETNPDKFWITTSQTWNQSNPENKFDFKVFKYENGIYTNLTKNLKKFNPSVTQIVHKAGSDDGLFIGTDVGVFYTDNSLDHWVDFNNGLPGTTVTSIRIDDVNHNLTAGTFGRGVWETSLSCMHDPNSMVITTTPHTPWDYRQTIMCDIYISAGVTLTITDQISLSLGSKIVVLPGGKLVIDGGTLTSACNGLWKGIEVWGTKNKSQLNTQYQGIVEIKNDGKICNARCAVRLVRMNDGIPALSTTGGILKCTNAKFINNKVAVDFYPYRNCNPLSGKEISNISYFKNSQFITNDFYMQPLDKPAMFVHLNGVKTIPFNGCLFVDSCATTNQTERGTGISSFASAFSVDQLCITASLPCNSLKRCRFEGLYYGIHAMGDGAAYYVNIDHTDFVNNLRGVYLGGVDLANITRNSFNTRTGTVDFPASGIYLDHCTGYSVQENSFTGHYNCGPFSNSTCETGIVLNNTGGSSNEIYNNSFGALINGISAQDMNRSTNGATGLVCKCNDYNNNGTDQSTLLSQTNANWGIAHYQGDNISDKGPAGNTFSPQHWTLQLPGSDLTNNGALFEYFHHHQIQNQLPRVQPVYYNNVTPRSTGWAYVKTTVCPSKLGSGGGTNSGAIKDELAIKDQLADTKELELRALVDGGDTQETTEDIAYSSPPEALEVRDELLAKSPYLSDTAMQTAVANDYVLPNAMIRDILVANPQSAISDKVLTELDERVDPMPEDMYNEILAGESVVSAKEVKDAELASLKSERFNLYNNLLTCYMIDTSLTAHDSLIAILAAEQTPESKYLLASVQLDDRDTISMNATLASIPSSYNLTTEQQALHEDYISYFALRLRMIDDTLYNSQPDSSQIVALFAMLEQSKEPVNVYARNLLIANNVISYSELYLFPDELKSSRARKHHNMATMKTATMMQVFPNPAINYIIVVYNLNNLPHDDIIDATLEINSMQGSILKQIILKRKEDQIVLPTSNLRPGNYVVLLKVDGKLIESRKLTILSD